MNAVEIEASVSDLAAEVFDAAEFPFRFLAAFDKKETTLKRLRKGDSNKSDVPGGVLLQSNIHLAVCGPGETRAMLQRLKSSPKTAAGKAKFILTTDGIVLEAEDLGTGETIAPDYPRFAEHIGFFLPLAGISTVREIKDNPIDVRATGRLNKLYIELLKQNPEWGTEARRHDMNHFMARLIFCFFAEDTDIFFSRALFTNTVEQFSESDGNNTHLVIQAVFGSMNTKLAERKPHNTPGYTVTFPYVNGGLFAGSTEVPQFTRLARSYLLQAGGLDWQHINPDIFGSMIQAVADDEERGALGMHYTSVPNILKVLNPLFLDVLRAQLAAAGENSRALLNLRRRMSRIRVFDPACGSGNFLVIAYKQMRIIEAEINTKRGEPMLPSEISKKNFRGIEIRDFAAEIARLALVIAEYQCDVLHRGPLAAKAEFLPLDEMNWIVRDNALHLDWLTVFPSEGTGVKLRSDDLFQTPLDQPEIDFENEGGEVYICGNPPYLGKGKLKPEQLSDMAQVFGTRTKHWGYIDYVGAWLLKAADYCRSTGASSALVTTNSIVMGRQAPTLWPLILSGSVSTRFAYTSFLWSNNAANKAAVFCVIVGLDGRRPDARWIYDSGSARQVPEISCYLTAGQAPLVEARGTVLSPELPKMILGNMPNDDGGLSLTFQERSSLLSEEPKAAVFVRRFYGSKEYNNDLPRYCLWVPDSRATEANDMLPLRLRFQKVRETRMKSPDAANRKLAERPYQMREFNECRYAALIIPRMTSERRRFLPCGILPATSIVSSQAFTIIDGNLWALSVLLSTLHLAWAATICGKFKEDIRYSSDLGWNTFPVPPLTEQDRIDLTHCAEDILLAREAHFPATVADLYDPDMMPADLRAAHEANDETLERIYIGRRFKNDTERLEKLFELYTKMMTSQGTALKQQGSGRKPKGQVTA